MKKMKISVKTIVYVVFFSAWLLQGCGSGKKDGTSEKGQIKDKGNDPEFEPQVELDLTAIKERGKLVAITGYSSTSYFIYRGQPMGYEYELLKRLAEHLDVELEVKVARNMDQVFEMLNTGEGDIVAYGMTITKDRKKKVAFTEHHNIIKQVLVQRKPENWRQMTLDRISEHLIRSPIDLIGETVHVRENSSYFHRLENLSEEIGGTINIDTVPGQVSTGELIKRVSTGEIQYTIADKNIAMINRTYYPNIDIKTSVSFPQRIAWAVRENSPELLQSVNDWIKEMRKQTDYYVIYNKYFKNRKRQSRRVQSEFYSATSGKISRYDHLFKEHGERINMDWRLLASLAYQESRFKISANSWAGAQGLMQMMPATAKRFGTTNPSNPEEGVKAGANYIQYLNKFWKGIPDSTERLKFILASYNVGEGHVKDAQRLAKKYDKDPKVWDDNVAEFILKKAKREYYTQDVVKYGYCRGSEPYKYVREIFERYEHYKQFTKPGDEEKEKKEA